MSLNAGRRARPPSPRGTRVFGNLLNFRRNEPDYVLNLAADFGGLVRIRSLVSDDFVVTDPAHFHDILVDHPERYDKQGFDYRTVGTAFGRGFGVADGKEWIGLRSLAPLLGRAGVAATAPVTLRHAAALLATWEPAAARRDTVDVKDAIRRLTCQVANEVMFGADHAADADWMFTAFDGLNERGSFGRHAISQALHWLPSPANRRFDAATRTLDAFIAARISEAHSRRHRPVDDPGAPLLDQLLRWRDEHGRPMPERELRDNIFNWLFDGTEATASTLIWTLWLLGSHPNTQAKMQGEVAAIAGDRPIALGDVDHLPWTRACWKEAARLYPSNYFLSRRALVDHEIGGYLIPAGASLTLSVYAAHHDPNTWPNPAAFDPTRFLPGHAADRHRLAYLPFGGGRRRCIAAQFAQLQAQLILGTLARHIRLTPVPGANVDVDAWTMLRPKGEFRMRLSPVSAPATDQLPTTTTTRLTP